MIFFFFSRILQMMVSNLPRQRSNQKQVFIIGKHDLSYLFTNEHCSSYGLLVTIKLLKVWTPEQFAAIILKFEQVGFSIK